MKFNKWTMGLAAVGVVSLASAARADEKPMSQVQTSLSNTTLSGYVDTAAVWRPGTDQGPGTQYYGYGPNTPYYYQNDGFYMNAVDISLDKPMDESPWASGYHVEMMYGYMPVGVSIGSNSGSGGATVRQAYIALRTPVGNSGIDWKVGVFDTIIGYESSSDPLNPNYTRSYGWEIEPTTHTGVVGTYKVNDLVSVTAGVANDAYGNSFGPTTTYESQKAYMGAVSLTAPDSWSWLKGATLYGGVVNGTDSAQYGNGSTTSWYLGSTIPTPCNALKLGAAFDYLDYRDGSYGNGETWVAGLYANYQINEKASVNLRGEYGQDDTGYLYGDYDTYPEGVARATFEEVTATLQYNLWANVISRLEFRWDHVENGNAFGYSHGNGEYGGGDPMKNNDFMLAANLIYQF